MALPAKVYWAKLQKELKGQSEYEQILILRRYVVEWPGWDDIQYRKMREQAEKLLHKLETNESTRSTKGQQDPFHVKHQGDGQICFIGAVNSGKSALVSTLTFAHTDVAEYPFTTQYPIPGMLEYHGAALQLVDTPALVPGTSQGEGSGRRLLHLFSTADAAGLVVDLSQDPLEQMQMILAELSAAQIMPLFYPIHTELHRKSRGGIQFTGIPITKAEQTTARQILMAHNIAHAEIRIRERFAADELLAQVEHRHPLPMMIIANKNDVPSGKDRLVALQQASPNYPIVDVNFLDEVNFHTLKQHLFNLLGLIRLRLLEKPSPDASHKNLIISRASTLAHVFERFSLVQTDRIKTANIWGTSVKYDGQEVGLEHLVEDGDKIWVHH